MILIYSPQRHLIFWQLQGSITKIFSKNPRTSPGNDHLGLIVSRKRVATPTGPGTGKIMSPQRFLVPALVIPEPWLTLRQNGGIYNSSNKPTSSKPESQWNVKGWPNVFASVDLGERNISEGEKLRFSWPFFPRLETLGVKSVTWYGSMKNSFDHERDAHDIQLQSSRNRNPKRAKNSSHKLVVLPIPHKIDKPPKDQTGFFTKPTSISNRQIALISCLSSEFGSTKGLPIRFVTGQNGCSMLNSRHLVYRM